MRFQISRNDTKLIIFCGFIFLGSFLILFFDIFTDQGQKSNQPVVAQTLEIDNDVRVKNAQNFAWTQSRTADLIRMGDQIFTGENSKTTLQFVDSQKLIINQNSLVKFDHKKNVKNFKIVFGSMSAEVKRGELIDVVICGETVRIQAESDDIVEISNSQNCQKPEIKMKNSVQNVNIKQSKSRSIASVSKALAEKTKPPSVVETILPPEPVIPLDLKSPTLLSENYKFLSTDTEKIISWNPVENAEIYKIKIKNAENSIKILQELETKSTSFNFHPEKIDLKYTFSISAVSSQHEYNNSEETQGKILIEFPPIKMYNPEKTYIFNAKTPNQTPPLIQHDLKWTVVPESIYYKVQVAQDPEFSTILFEDKTKKSTYKYQLKDIGKVYYRVKAFNENKTELAHSTRLSYLEYIKNFDLRPPEILPAMKEQAFFFQKTEGQFVRLTWQNSQASKAPKYFIEISKDPNFKSILKKYKTDKTQLFISEVIPQGQYYWRVKSFGDEFVSDWSEIAKLNIKSKRDIATENDNSFKSDKNSQLNR